MTRPLGGGPPPECRHCWNYAGVRFFDSDEPRPGTGARRRYYAHIYNCMHCMETRGEPIPDPYDNYNTYQEIRFGATPGTREQCHPHG